jgi:predicted amidohydrolase YtcJ
LNEVAHMTAPARGRRSVLATAVVIAHVTSCSIGGASPLTSASCPVDALSRSPSAQAEAQDGQGNLVIVGRVLTMGEPTEAEALLIIGGNVACAGTRDEVLAAAGERVRIVDIGANVAYPGFLDAHAHWIGDRDYYGLASAEEAMDAALSRGWTSISEQWVNPERLDELIALAADDALPIRVDAYLALNFGDEFFGDWYTDHVRGPMGDRLRIQGLKIHLDDGAGAIVNWKRPDLLDVIGRADAAGWQVSVHTVSTQAHDLVLDAFEAAIGPNGPNPLHHRIEHAIEVSDDQLGRMVAMDLVTVIHPDGVAGDWVQWNDYMGRGAAYPADQIGWLGRWRDFVDAGLHVAAASDAPWFFSGFALADDLGRPVDHIAGGMDGRGRESAETPAWVLDQLLSAEHGLQASTVGAAYALGDEARRGRLGPGSLGDVTILSGDVADATADEIRAMTVVATIVGGVIEYCSDSEICAVSEE